MATRLNQEHRHYRPHSIMGEALLLADAKLTKAYGEWKIAHDAYTKAKLTKLSDYKALIEAASTLEQIEEVWPEAGEKLRIRIKATLPVVLSDEVMARIRADAATRKKIDKVEVSQDFQRRPARTVQRYTETVTEPEEFVSDED